MTVGELWRAECAPDMAWYFSFIRRSQFSDEDMRRMDAPFEALDMFPDSMHRLLSYEDMLSGVLTGNSSEDQDTELKLDRNGVDTLDTCGFPLFSHDLQNAEPDNTMDTPSMDKVRATPIHLAMFTLAAESRLC